MGYSHRAYRSFFILVNDGKRKPIKNESPGSMGVGWPAAVAVGPKFQGRRRRRREIWCLLRDCVADTRILLPQLLATPADESGTAYLPASDNKAARRRRTSSYGIIWTLPESISSILRLISSFQAASTPSSQGSSSRLSNSDPAKAARASGGRARAFLRSSETSGLIRAILRSPGKSLENGQLSEVGYAERENQILRSLGHLPHGRVVPSLAAGLYRQSGKRCA